MDSNKILPHFCSTFPGIIRFMKRSSSSHGGEEYAGRFVADDGVEHRLFGGLSSSLSCLFLLLLVVSLSKDDSMFEDSACSS